MIIRTAPIRRAMWMIPPILLKKMNPNNHSSNIIIPIINNNDILAPFDNSIY